MSTTDSSGATNWLQVGIAAITQNFATGLAFGSFGTIVLAIEKEYAADRSTSSLAISCMVVSLAITASLLGRLLEKVSIRSTMMLGALLGASGFAAASFVHEAWQLLAIYFLVLGPATAMLGVLPSMTLAARWATDKQRGLAMGIINMPVMVMVVPLVIAPLLLSDGVRVVYQTLAVVDLALIPLLLLVRDRPPGQATRDSDAPQPERSAPPAESILRRSTFWVFVIALGLLAGAGTMKLAHFVPLLTEQGRTFEEANTLLAVSGGAGVFGSLIFGALADRIGGAKALICNALVQAAMWTIFLAPVGFGVLLADAIIIGACGAGLQAAFGVVLVTSFGRSAFSRAYGLSSLFTIPFLFGLTPLASLLYEASGNYHLPMGLMIGGFLIAAGLLLTQVAPERKRRLINIAIGEA